MDNLVELLAALEHEQWIFYSKGVVERYGSYLPDALKSRWKGLWVPYEQLSEEMKEFDREWARKALAIVLVSQAKTTN